MRPRVMWSVPLTDAGNILPPSLTRKSLRGNGVVYEKDWFLRLSECLCASHFACLILTALVEKMECEN
jgi:hypothetical protein